MKTCIPCGGRPSYPLFNLCRFCLQEKMDREVDRVIQECAYGERQFPSYRKGLPLP